MEIRLFRESDIPEAVDLQNSLFPVKYPLYQYHRYMESNWLSLVLEEKGKLIGIVTCRRVWRSFFSAEKDCYISTFGIKADHRRRHLGSRLLSCALKILRDRFHCITARLDVLATNTAAIKFYEKFGFTVAERVTNMYETADGIRMEMDLDGIQLEENTPRGETLDELLSGDTPLPSYFMSFLVRP